MRKIFSAINNRTAQTFVLIALALSAVMFVSCEDGLEDVTPTVTQKPDPDPGKDPQPNSNLVLAESELELNYDEEPALYHAVAVDSMITTVVVRHMDGETLVLDTLYQKNPWFDVDVKAREERAILVSSLNALKVTSALTITAEDPTVSNIDGYYDRKVVYNGTFNIGTEGGETSQYNVVLNNQDFSKFFSAEKSVVQMPHAPFVAGDVVVLGENTEMGRDSITEGGKKYYLVPMNLVFKSYRNKVDATAKVEGSAETYLVSQARSMATKAAASTRSSVVSDYVHDANFVAIVKVAAENAGTPDPDPKEELINYNNLRASYTILPNSNNISGKVRSTSTVNTQWKVAADRDSTFTMIENYGGSQPADIHIVLGVGKSASITDKEISRYPSADVQGDRTYNVIKNWYSFKVDGVKYEGDYWFNWVTGYFTILEDQIWFKTPNATMSENATYELVSENVDVTVEGKNYKRTTYKEVVKVVFGGDYGTENITMGRNIVIDVLQEDNIPDPERDDLVKKPVLKGKYAEIVGNEIKFYNIYEIERNLSGRKDTTVFVMKPFSFEAPNGDVFTQDEFGYAYSTSNNNETSNGLVRKLTTNYLFKLANGTVVTRTYVVNYSQGGSFTLFGGTEFALTDSFKEVKAAQTFGSITPGSEVPNGDFVEVSYAVKNNIVLIENFSNGHTDVVKVEDYVHPTKGRYLGHRGRTLSICNYQAGYLWSVDLVEWESGLEVFANGESKDFWRKEDLAADQYASYNSATSKGPGDKWFPAIVSVHTISGKGYWEWAGKDANGVTYASSYKFGTSGFSSGDWSVKGVNVTKANGQVTITSPNRPTTVFSLR